MRMAFALVTVLIACGSPQGAAPAAAPAPAPSGDAVLEARTAAPSAMPAGKKKRTRTGPPSPGARDGTKPKNGRPLNPHDPSGRTVFVRADDHCFVEVASRDPETQATEDVDCPAEANDPAFDHCTAQVVLEPGTSRCYCVTGRGNPRPMPNPTPCPANAK